MRINLQESIATMHSNGTSNECDIVAAETVLPTAAADMQAVCKCVCGGGGGGDGEGEMEGVGAGLV